MWPPTGESRGPHLCAGHMLGQLGLAVPDEPGAVEPGAVEPGVDEPDDDEPGVDEGVDDPV